MTKIAMIGSIHADGWSILENNGCDVFEIKDFSLDNLIANLQDVDGIALRSAKLNKDILENCHKLKRRPVTPELYWQNQESHYPIP